jgi:hypothetical protein
VCLLSFCSLFFSYTQIYIFIYFLHFLFFGPSLYEAPKGRSWNDFLSESKSHGWPSFRDPEVIWDDTRCMKNGEAVSLAGTHLGHNLPDKKGNRTYFVLMSLSHLKDTFLPTYYYSCIGFHALARLLHFIPHIINLLKTGYCINLVSIAGRDSYMKKWESIHNQLSAWWESIYHRSKECGLKISKVL